MFLESLSITNFKNHAEASFSFREKLNGFCGHNGVGKTNILDSIFYLCSGKSHFIATDAETVRHGQNFFRISGSFLSGEKIKYNISVQVEPGKSKEIFVNGKKIKSIAAHVGTVPVIFQAPDDIYKLLDLSAERRKWIDRAIAQQDKEYLENLVFYHKLLKQRNAFLKSEPQANNTSLLDWYDQKMAPVAALISVKRHLYMKEVNEFFQSIYESISSGSEKVFVDYVPILAQDEWLSIFRGSQKIDMIAQRTTVGIQRDDIIFTMDEKPLKRVGSQGQVKSYILSLILSQFLATRQLHHKVPILLLDDIFARLDQQRVSNLLKFLHSEKTGSIFITDTDANRVKKVMVEAHHSFDIFQL